MPSNEPVAFPGGTVTVADAKASGEIGGVPANGSWDATLYGSRNPGQAALNASDPEKYPVTRYPVADLAGIAGNFYINSDNAALSGAFGATPR